MTFIDSERAGKRVCVWLDKNGTATKVVPVPKQNSAEDYNRLTSGGHVMYAGAAVSKKYLCYSELIEMYPRLEVSVTRNSNTSSAARSSSRVKERKERTRWGLTSGMWPRWVPVSDKIRPGDAAEKYLRVEDRIATVSVSIEGDRERILSVSDVESRGHSREGVR